jgi:hypothetical protein
MFLSESIYYLFYFYYYYSTIDMYIYPLYNIYKCINIGRKYFIKKKKRDIRQKVVEDDFINIEFKENKI